MSRLKQIYLENGPAGGRVISVAKETKLVTVRVAGEDYDYETKNLALECYSMEVFRKVIHSE
jgi:hypothetical protein